MGRAQTTNDNADEVNDQDLLDIDRTSLQCILFLYANIRDPISHIATTHRGEVLSSSFSGWFVRISCISYSQIELENFFRLRL